MNIYKRLLLIASVCFFAFQSLAGPKTAEEALAEYQKKIQVLSTSLDADEVTEALEDLIPSKEAADALRTRLEHLTDLKDVLEVPDISYTVLVLSEAFLPMASKHDKDLLVELAHWAEVSTLAEELQIYLLQSVLFLNQRSDVPSLKTAAEIFGTQVARPQGTLMLPSVLRNAHEAALIEVERFMAFMNKRVQGQEHILDSIRSMYLKDMLMNGERLKPELFYFMGLPGNGKDTIAENLVDAMYGHEAAHLDHMFRMTIRSRADAWNYFGSNKGYIGSNELPALLRFLVEHSGGKYILNKEIVNKEERTIVEENPAWSPDEFTLKFKPNKAVIFINEAHDIPRLVKNDILKQAVERGYFPISNPGSTPNSAKEIVLPVTFIFASNEGISLLEPREKNGSRMGPPLSYEQLIENFDRVYLDTPLLRQAILSTNGERNDAPRPDEPGTSEEFLNRFPSHRIHILRPLHPDNLQIIGQNIVNRESQRFARANGNLGQYTINLTQEMIEFIVEYDAIPSENARPIADRLESFVFSQIVKAIGEKEIQQSGGVQNILVDIIENPDHTYSARFTITEVTSGNTYEFVKPLEQTFKDRAREVLSQERIEEILSMRQQIIDNAFGVEMIVDRLLESVLVSESESRNSGESKRPATVIAFLGLTSTGKTETAKQYVRARYGDSQRPTIIDFNGIQTVQDIKAKILGSYDSRNNPIASDFMKAYDRANGNLAFIFDEAANAPMELLKSLYEIFREATASGFSDGKARPMKNVTIILTGNAGDRIYKLIPEDLPTEVYERAQHEVFRLFLNNPDLQQRILNETFPEPLLARIGNNIYHFGPLLNRSKRQLAQLKLIQGLNNLRPRDTERGWNVVFADEQDVLDLFNLIELEGFNSRYQGASIDSFVRLAIVDKIKARLLSAGVTSGTQVLLEVAEKPTLKKERDITFTFREIHLTTVSGQTFTIEIPLSKKIDSIPDAPTDRILTAYHEVGHEIVSEVYFGDRIRPSYLSIIEGVTLVGSSFVHYAGIRSGDLITRSQRTKQVVLRDAALMLGGTLAQQLITIGGRHDAGKRNDINRATEMIQNAILRDGLSDEWGNRSVPVGMNLADFINEFSPDDKAKLNRITDRWFANAEQLAKDAIYVNMDGLFVPLSKKLAEQGYLDEDDIAEIYAAHPPVTERSANYTEKVDEVHAAIALVDTHLEKLYEIAATTYHRKPYDVADAEKVFNQISAQDLGFFRRLTINYIHSPWSQLTALQKAVVASYMGTRIRDQSRDARLSGTHWVPSSLADIDEIIERERQEATQPVTDLTRFDILPATQPAAEIPRALLEAPKPIAAASSQGSRMCRDLLAD